MVCKRPPINGANLPFYSYPLTTQTGCAPEIQTYSVEITCLDPNASPATTTQLNVAQGPLTVYPSPDLGVNFTPSASPCTVAPVDLCGGLVMTYTPSTNPTAGAGNTTVTYNVSVSGAPNGCAATGTYVVQCPAANCASDAGSGATPADNVICSGGSFSLSTTGTTLGTGYSLGYAWTTTNPYNNLDAAVTAAITAGNYLGPYAATSTPSFTNGVDFQPGTYYFIPFTSLNIAQSSLAYQATGTFSVSAPFGGGSATVNIPANAVAYCQGITQYDITLTANQQNNTGNLSAIDDVTGPLITYNGNATTALSLANNNFPRQP